MADEPTGDTGSTFDMDAGVASIASDIFPPEPEPDKAEDAETPTEIAMAPAPVAAKPPTTPTPPDTPQVRTAPKAWPKEMHEHWGKLDPKLQTYWETREKQMLDGLDQYKTEATFAKSLREVMAPYRGILQAAGIDEPRAVQTLLAAHQRLTQGPQHLKLAAYQELGKKLGLMGADPNAPAADPALKAIEDRLNSFESSFMAREQAVLTDAQARTAKEVDVFASDAAHAYFDEVADDIVPFIKAGVPLQEAYEKAVWANPVTRAKEIARVQTEHEAKLRENARLEALPKKKAAGVNVRSRETEKTPTEPLGTMEDTMRSTLRGIKERVH